MILCQCCRAWVTIAPIETRFGVVDSPFGLCRRCWGRVPRELRRLLAKTLRGYREWPSFERAIETWRAWALCLGDGVWVDPLVLQEAARAA